MNARPLPSTVAHLDGMVASGAPGYLVISTPMTDRTGNPWASRSFPVSAVDEAAQVVADLDAQGQNVYVRTNLLADPLPADGGWSWKRGAAAATGAAVAFAVDLDVAGPGHRQATTGNRLPSTLEEAMTIVAELPPPSLTIATGGGAHLWWFFETPETQEPVTVLEEWADRIVAAGAVKGLHVDRPDAARVLRVCGTTRRKPGVAPNPVTLADAAHWPEHGLSVRPWRPASYSSADLLAALPRPVAAVQAKATTPGAPAPCTRSRLGFGGVGPADAAARLSWAQILEPLGWEPAGSSTMGGASVELWRRPGASSVYSLKCIPDGPAVAWSDGFGLPTGGGQRLSKWRVFVLLHHGGDEVGAARRIRNLQRERRRRG